MSSHSAFTLEVATPLGLKLNQKVEAASVPGAAGEFTVLAHHRPLLSALKVGVLHFDVPASDPHNKTQRVAIGAGFAEVDANYVKIITDRFAMADEINRAEVEKARDEAAKKLAAFQGPADSAEYQELKENLDWADACLSITAKLLH